MRPQTLAPPPRGERAEVGARSSGGDAGRGGVGRDPGRASPPGTAVPAPNASPAEGRTRPCAPARHARRPRGDGTRGLGGSAPRDGRAPGRRGQEELGEAKAGTDAPPAEAGRGGCPRPPAVAAALRWLSSRGKRRNRSSRFPKSSPVRKKVQCGSGPGGAEHDTARRPAPSGGLPEPLPAAASSLPPRSPAGSGAARSSSASARTPGRAGEPPAGVLSAGPGGRPSPRAAGLPALGRCNVLREVEPRGRNAALR